MKKGCETLFSKYIIDGVVKENTPADMLKDCFFKDDWERVFAIPNEGERLSAIVDETADRSPVPFKYDSARIEGYLKAVRKELSKARKGGSPVIIAHPYSSARILLAESILQSIWLKTDVKLDNLFLSVSVFWDSAPMGHMAAFHRAVESLSGYVYELGLHIRDLNYNISPDGKELSESDVRGRHEMDFKVVPAEAGAEAVPGRLLSKPETTLLYVPFDTCAHRLGGSLLGSALGRGDEPGPEVSDPDYFIDSFEVVHDLVEDGVVLGGVAVGRGGMIAAASDLLGKDHDLAMDLTGVQRAYMENDPVRLLFSEIPGVLLQIPEAESGYVDSQFLLQDIAYYPIGQPVKGRGRITLSQGNRADIARILSALIDGRMPEDPEISNFSEGTEKRSGPALD